MTSEQMQQEIWQLKQALMEERLTIGGVIEDRNQIATRLAAAEKVIEAARVQPFRHLQGWPDDCPLCQALADFDAAKEDK